jgi:hypothetical protein|tara:strand:- start:56 stop:385 length:330 start_codon:yes stop_codon:yes gene_type:complete
MPIPNRYNLDRMAIAKDLEYYGHINVACTIASKYCKMKPDNKELRLLSDSLVGIFFWGNQQEQDRRIYDKELSEFRADKNRAVLRARKSELEVTKLRKEIEKLKSLANL